MGSIGSPQEANDMANEGSKDRQTVSNPSRAPWEVRNQHTPPGACLAPGEG
jgi:hypothetical protein